MKREGLKIAAGLLAAACVVGCTSDGGAEPAPSASPAPSESPAESASPAPSASPSESVAPSEETGTVEIQQTYEGRVNVPPAALGGAPSPTRVIQSAEKLASFVRGIPKKKVQKKQPAPPSDDPLLKDPAIDFGTSTMLVLIRGDTMYIHPEFVSVERKGEGVHVRYRWPPLGGSAMAAAVLDMGTYQAVVIPKVEGEITWERVPNPEGDGR